MPNRLVAVLCVLAYGQLALAAPHPAAAPHTAPAADIPRNPVVPPNLTIEVPKQSFHCQRSFVYDGKTLSCDSNIRQDGEGLRPILMKTPAALAELETYQRNRRSIRSAAYFGTAGLVLGFLGLIIGSQISNPDGSGPSLTGIAVRNTLLLSGIGLAGGSFLYGFSLMRGNEEHLIRATQHYNAANPNKPIELKFDTGITF